MFALYVDVYVALYAAGKLAEHVIHQFDSVLPEAKVREVAKVMTAEVDDAMSDLAESLLAGQIPA